MEDGEHQAQNNRLIFLSIVGIPVTIILAATWLWYFVARGDLDLVGILGTSNHGSLVQPPRRLDEGRLQELEGRAFLYADLAPRWTFLIPGGGTCEATCEGVLYLTRQIHLAMGQEMKRIQRVYVSDVALSDTRFELAALSDQHPVSHSFQQYLEKEQRGLRAYTVSYDSFATLFPEYSSDSGIWYLVDPAGWIMMSYSSEVSYKDVMADLTFLLKNSSE